MTRNFAPTPPDTEEWRSIPSIPCHEASNEGRIRNKATSAIVAPYVHKSGYFYIFLTPKGGEREAPKQVHRLCLEAFRGPCPKDHETLHVDDNPLNNRLSNLRWSTKTDNGRDKRRERRLAEMRRRKDERDDIDREAVCQAYSEGGRLKDVAKAHGTSTERIKRILMEESVELRGPTGVAPKFDHDLIVSMYIAGQSQYAVAEAVGCSQKTVVYALNRANLSTGYKFIDRQRVKGLFEVGLRPIEIAKSVGCDPKTASNILAELAASGQITYAKRGARQVTDLDRIRRLAADGMSNQEIATATGYSPSTVWKANGNLNSQLVAERNASIVTDFKSGQHSDAIAEAYGVAGNYVLSLARKAGLKVKNGALRITYGAACASTASAAIPLQGLA